MSTPAVHEASAAKRLATLSVLRAHWSEGKSYVDIFLPFALEAVRLEGGTPVAFDAIRTRMLEEFGIPIPYAALETILRRANKNGHGHVRGGAFVPDSDATVTFDSAAARQAALREQTSLIDRVVEAAKENGLTWTSDEAAEAVANYLDHHATSVLAVTHGQDTPEADSDPDVSPADYVIAKLFSVILEREPEPATHLERLVVGTMLASALFTPDIDKITDPFCCDVYLDTPVLIDALGQAGTIPAKAARESITLLREAGATLKVFDHTVVEIERKLSDVAHQLRDPRQSARASDTIIANATSRNLTPADLEQAAGRVRRDVEHLKVDVVEAPLYERSTTVDEVEAKKILETTLGHSRKTTIEFDLDSLTAVHRLRRGQRKYRIETCQAIFVTPHRRLVAASREIFAVGRNAPVAVALADLVTLAWLKKPRVVPDLPRLRIAADCYATIQPSAGLVRKYVDEASKLYERGAITRDDLYEIRYGYESRRILMDKSKGSVAAVDESLVADVLEERNRQIAARARHTAERDANAARAELQSEREGRRADAAHFEQRIDELETRARGQEVQLANARESELERIHTSARRRARLIVRPAALTILAAAAVTTLFTFPWLGHRVAAPIGLHVLATLPAGAAWVARALCIAVAVLLIVANLWGWGFGRLMSAVEQALEQRLLRRAHRASHWNRNA